MKTNYRHLGQALLVLSVLWCSHKAYASNDVDSLSYDLNIQQIEVISSFAKQRSKAPVSLSNVSKDQISIQSPAAEFPELLRSTPSLFSSRQGGGFGDSRITLRGFGSENIALLINGILVNGAENGAIYWSNWSALLDVAQKVQVQRGVGLSNLGLYSVGGTVNIITDVPQEKSSSSVYLGTGNDGYMKTTASYSTGELKGGWSATMLAGFSRGNGYVTATEFESFTYYLSVVKRLNAQQRLVLTAFGAPQWHNRRSNKHAVEDYANHPDGIRMNTSYGFIDGKIVPTYSGFNKYHKPQVSLSHYWNISSNTVLSTVVYGSIATGGGRKVLGSAANRLQYNYKTGKPNTGANPTDMAADGTIDYGPVVALNEASSTGSSAIFALGSNSHRTFGINSSLNKQLNEKLNLRLGLDASKYLGDHYDVITDLLGGAYYTDKSLAWRDPATQLGVGDRVTQDYLSKIGNVGLFGQLNYQGEVLDAFFSATVSDRMYKRFDPGRYGEYSNQEVYPADQKETEMKHFQPVSLKGGVNFHLGQYQRIFVNGGYVTRAPMFENVYNYNTYLPNSQCEKITSLEVGYGLLTDKIDILLNAYMTKWMDKSTVKAIGSWNGPKACIPDIDALHKGIELEIAYRPIKSLAFNGAVSLGEWKWLNDVSYSYYDENGTHVGDFNAYVKDLHVGNAPQTSAYANIEWLPLPQLNIGVSMYYYGRIYADFSPDARTNADDRADSWKMPDYTLCNAHVKYTLFQHSKVNVDLFGNVDNLLDVHYISDAVDGANHDEASAYVWYGLGRVWNVGMRFRF